jgi:hypothetical protein
MPLLQGLHPTWGHNITYDLQNKEIMSEEISYYELLLQF